MKTYASIRQRVSHTLDICPRTSLQAPINQILQTYLTQRSCPEQLKASYASDEHNQKTGKKINIPEENVQQKTEIKKRDSSSAIQRETGDTEDEFSESNEKELAEIIERIKDIAVAGETIDKESTLGINMYILQIEEILKSGNIQTKSDILAKLNVIENESTIQTLLASYPPQERSQEKGVVQGMWITMLWEIIKTNPIKITAGIVAIYKILKKIVNSLPKSLYLSSITKITPVPSDQVQSFSNALKKMPYVQNLYNHNIYTNMQSSNKSFSKINKTQWKNKGCLQHTIAKVKSRNPFIYSDTEVENGNFNQKVAQTDKFIKQTVQPNLLKEINRPVIAVHLRNQDSRIRKFGFRAYYQSDTETVHVPQDTSQEVIAHETGHHIEEHCQSLWPHVQSLLESRNDNKTKATNIYERNWEEQRYSGNYPATGPYTARFYSHGSTEVTSMSLQYLSNPNKFKDLIERDPQQAATILRAIRPNEFDATTDLDPFRQYLLP